MFESVLLSERGGEAGIMGCDRRLRRAEGDLDALAEPELSAEPSGSRWRRAADRVIGAMYPSGVSDRSDIEGVGDSTRGVAGAGCGEDMSGALGLKEGIGATRSTPEGGRTDICVVANE